ncbi:hypothetical protein B0H15DRAFT_828470 [Mycena belliarum]|uniref:Uncharacterized protein n=1 Tax=Mycena belliarum TaxID=1033014 RepID=A0AAD6XRY4_9AGAR|nr:hypothetical protein B0H15DRAFT_828470 [Mycena belliae]
MAENDEGSFFADVLKPGSSLQPQFILILDTAFVSLFCILILLVVLTGSLHVYALIAIELALWASVKWFVNELRNTPIPTEDVQSKKAS